LANLLYADSLAFRLLVRKGASFQHRPCSKHQRLALGAKRGKIHSTSVYTTQCLISAAKLKFHRGPFSLPFNFHSYRVAVSHSFILW